MEIPKLNISITKSAVNGQVVDVVEYDDYVQNKDVYSDRTDIGIPTEYKGKDIILPTRGQYPASGVPPMTPGVYNAGCVDFFVTPDEAFLDKYIPKNSITMNNQDNIRDLIIAGEQSKKLDEPFITSPDNITIIPIKENDQPEMICLKTALNSKHFDIDKYASRFGDNFPNDKRQLKSVSATLNIIKRFCSNCDMEAILILRDKSPNVPNPMNREVAISLTEPLSDDLFTTDYNASSLQDED